MGHVMSRTTSAVPARSIGYWAVMIAGIVAIVALYAGILAFGQAW